MPTKAVRLTAVNSTVTNLCDNGAPHMWFICKISFIRRECEQAHELPFRDGVSGSDYMAQNGCVINESNARGLKGNGPIPASPGARRSATQDRCTGRITYRVANPEPSRTGIWKSAIEQLTASLSQQRRTNELLLCAWSKHLNISYLMHSIDINFSS